jgi:pimeloyl-ACP methyl ester carboxylesterase
MLRGESFSFLVAGQNRLPSDHGLQASRKRFKFFPSMDSSGPTEPPPPPSRLAGLAGLWRAARNLGLLGGHPWGTTPFEHFVASDGQSIPVHVVGDGPPVLLVHGLGCSHRHWMPVARKLAHRHCVFAWDARGHGLCRPVASAVSLSRLAQDLRELMDHFGLARPVLVGHSMGALTIMQYLHDHGTERVAGAVLVDQSPRLTTDDEWRLGLFGGCSAAMLHGLIASARHDPAEAVMLQMEAGAPHWWHRALATDAWAGRALRRWLRARDVRPLLDLAESLAAADFRQSLARMDAPLRVVLGEQSAHYKGVPLEAWYRKVVPHCSVSRFTRAGHSPHFTEPARFAQELLAFIRDHA